MSFAPLHPHLGVEHKTHAYLLESPDAEYAKYQVLSFCAHLFCEREDACGHCASCKQVAAMSHPDFYHVAPEKNHITIDQVRAMTHALQMKPTVAAYKIVWIERADTMGIPAQNALLKTLEEPPGYAILFMSTPNEKRLLATIRSRTRKVHFENATTNAAIDEEALTDLLVDVGNKDVNRAFHAMPFFAEYQEDKEGVVTAIESLLTEMMVFKATNSEKQLERPFLKERANALHMEPAHIARVLAVCRRVRDGLGRNINFQLSMERIMIEMLEDRPWSKS